ncbi:regulatory protein, luxR family [Thermoactinomyces sp. DSM 45891]|uniref:helix-turn-helix transcriptional regulator n=1 Tax=Thermoactinomyces sp. DSM 45891 TaxID=1761907 RepID=UPI0009143EAD|nr:LuxR C-terminal-related transcriptional regulator [Thermoactinomyces sp. DSM 45891]SFX60538.1 regulatory protein, luxR family [Thermoactinomyces sp. DSM 45891]
MLSDIKPMDFSEVECKIIHMIIQEMPNKEMAVELHCSQRMVEYRIQGIAKKMGVSTKVGIVAGAFRSGIAS